MAMKTLGRTGMKVSRLCLGNMMFGSIGNPDHDDCVKIIQLVRVKSSREKHWLEFGATVSFLQPSVTFQSPA
jgi:hypothetical protein